MATDFVKNVSRSTIEGTGLFYTTFSIDLRRLAKSDHPIFMTRLMYVLCSVKYLPKENLNSTQDDIYR